MKKYYKVVSEYFDNGKVNAYCEVVYADVKPCDSYESLSKCDRYIDYFTDHAKAEKWLQDALNA